MDGWPTEKKDLPHQVAQYFPYRDELSVQDGLVFRGERVVIPTDLRQTLKERVHWSHLGIEGCLRRARECLFWPNMNADLKEYISACSLCRSHETSQQRDTLMPHDVPDRLWAKVGTDLFSISDTSYLIVVDYVSNFWEVDKLDNTDSVTVIKKMKTHFARYGIPDQVVQRTSVHVTSLRKLLTHLGLWTHNQQSRTQPVKWHGGVGCEDSEDNYQTSEGIEKWCLPGYPRPPEHTEAKHAKQPGSKPDEQTYQYTPAYNRQPACTETDLRPARCSSKQQTATRVVSRSPRQRSPTSARRRCRAYEAVSEARETRVEAGRSQ